MSGGPVGALCGAAAGLGAVFGIAAFRSPTAKEGTVRLRMARFDKTRLSAAGRKTAVCTGIGVVAGVATGWPVAAIAVGAGGWWLPGLLGPDRDTARQIARIEAVAVFAEMMRDTLSAASGIEQAVSAACSGAPAAIAVQAAALARRIEDQEELTGALAAFADDVQDPTCDIIVVCLSHALRHSARDLAALLGSLATTARAHAAQRKRTHAARAQIRTGVRIVTAVTLGLLAGLFAFDRSFLSPYDSAVGQVVLAIALLMFAAGYAWLWKMAHPRVRPRLLTRMDHAEEAVSWWS